MANPSNFQVIQGGGQSQGPSLSESKKAGESVIARLTSGGAAMGTSLAEVHRILTGPLEFSIVQKTTDGVLPDGYQLFYRNRNALVRIKTKGTRIRPWPHMTVSLINNALDWDSEQAKFNAAGGLSPKTLVGPASGSSTPMRVIQCNPPLTTAMQDDWANQSHFNFAPGFDDAAAVAL